MDVKRYKERKYATEPRSVKDENGKTYYKLAFKLAPCPFCGGNDLDILDDSGVIYCRTCQTMGPIGEHGGGYAWNEWYYRINGTTETREDIARISRIVEGNANMINEISVALGVVLHRTRKIKKGLAKKSNDDEDNNRD